MNNQYINYLTVNYSRKLILTWLDSKIRILIPRPRKENKALHPRYNFHQESFWHILIISFYLYRRLQTMNTLHDPVLSVWLPTIYPSKPGSNVTSSVKPASNSQVKRMTLLHTCLVFWASGPYYSTIFLRVIYLSKSLTKLYTPKGQQPCLIFFASPLSETHAWQVFTHIL